MSHTTKDQRNHLCPAIEELCTRYGGITKIQFVVAFKALNDQEWDTLIARVGHSVSDRVTDRTPLIVNGRLTEPGNAVYMNPNERTDR